MGSHRVKPKIFEFFQYINFILADKVVSVSKNIKSELQPMHKNTHKIIVVENGVNTNLFYPKDREETRRSLTLNQDCYYLVFVGSFYPHHGVRHIIHILFYIIQKLPNERLIKIGSGY